MIFWNSHFTLVERIYIYTKEEIALFIIVLRERLPLNNAVVSHG